MKNLVRLISGIALSAFLLQNINAQPQPRKGPPRSKKPQGPDMVIKMLNKNPELAKEVGISQEQIDQLKDLKIQSQKDAVALKSELEMAQIEMQELLQSDSPDVAEVMKAADKVGKARTELQKNGLKTMLKGKEIIGPEAMQKIKEKMKDRMTKRSKKSRSKSKDKVEEDSPKKPSGPPWMDDTGEE